MVKRFQFLVVYNTTVCVFVCLLYGQFGTNHGYPDYLIFLVNLCTEKSGHLDALTYGWSQGVHIFMEVPLHVFFLWRFLLSFFVNCGFLIVPLKSRAKVHG